MQDRHQPRRVPAVQSDGRFVQHVQRAHQPRSQRRCQLNPLRLAAAQRRRQPVQRQILQANIVQELQPLLYLLQNFSRDLRLLARELQRLKKLRCLLHRQLRQLAYVLAFNLHLQRVRPQPPAAALRTLRVPPIPAQKNAHVQLVFLPLQHGEEALYAGKLAFAFNHQLLLVACPCPATARQTARRSAWQTSSARSGTCDTSAWSTAQSRLRPASWSRPESPGSGRNQWCCQSPGSAGTRQKDC